MLIKPDLLPSQPERKAFPKPKVDYTKIELEPGIKVPSTQRAAKGSSAVQALVNRMKVGDSFLVPHGCATGASCMVRKVWGKKSNTVRKIDLEFSRVWRIR